MSKKDYESIVIIDDDDITQNNNNIENTENNNNNNTDTDNIQLVEPKKRTRTKQLPLKKSLLNNEDIYEIGVDEAGRGPLFGPVYTAAVVLPKDNDLFDHTKMKDSKKFHSKKKIEEVANYIKQNAIAWSVTFEDEKSIDDINILQATQKSMHNSILQTYKKLIEKKELEVQPDKVHLLIDGNYFNIMTIFDKKKNKIEQFSHTTVEGGDNKYSAIAAASILAKVARDEYIDKLCSENPNLAEHYGIDSNKGYGAKKHIDGIKEHGITIWHRRTFGICKNYADADENMYD